jgi:uncharacterized protein YggE
MTEITNALIYKVLQDVQAGQAEHRAQLNETRAQIAVLTQGQVNIRTELAGLSLGVKDLKGYVQEVAIILDHHGRRLDAIERHLGLDKATH